MVRAPSAAVDTPAADSTNRDAGASAVKSAAALALCEKRAGTAERSSRPLRRRVPERSADDGELSPKNFRVGRTWVSVARLGCYDERWV